MRLVARLSCLLLLGSWMGGCGDDDGSGSSPPDGGTSLDATSDATAPPLDGALPDSAPPPPIEGPVVETGLGPVVGVQGDGFQEFLGIPYAAPPVGERRYRAPAPPAPWASPYDATAKPPACAQSLLGGSLRIGEEDCLYLNVHVPDPRPENAPVLVWFHGGAFVLGEGLQTDGGTAGDVLAREEGLVVVSMNYRLGQLGFLAHPALADEQPEGGSGNYGFLDQIAALAWVRDHIADFGGDPGRVTIAGESAGGMSVCDHLVSPASRGLFHRAIIESGPCARASIARPTAEAQGERFAREVGCTGADVPGCLRNTSLATLRNTLPASAAIVLGMTDATGQWRPVADGTVLPGETQSELEAGRFAEVPVITGWNADEGTLFVALAELAGEPTIDEARYRELLVDAVGEAQADRVLEHYPVSDYPDARYALAEALGDGVLGCPARRTVRALSGRVAVRTYLFTYAGAEFQLPLRSTLELGAFHSAEIQFVFGHRSGGRPFSAEEQALHEAMRGRWARFVESGDPGGTPVWPEHNATTDQHLVLDSTIELGTGADVDDCAFWDTVPDPES